MSPSFGMPAQGLDKFNSVQPDSRRPLVLKVRKDRFNYFPFVLEIVLKEHNIQVDALNNLRSHLEQQHTLLALVDHG
jgi:hypothetical protein